MTARRGLVNELCFAAEGLAGTAASTSLRRLSRLAEAAPSGRLFGAIATLSDMSVNATRSLEEGQDAMSAGDHNRAATRLARALAQLDDLAALASGAAESREQPSYLRKSR